MTAIDVVVPCYNYGRFLKYCIDSVLMQEGVELRVLIIDDASKDESASIGKVLASQDPRVTFRGHVTNKGHIKTFNEGVLDWATAPYTLLLSADDALTPGSLKRAVDVLEKCPEAGMVYGIARLILGEEMPAHEALPVTPTYQIIPGKEFLRRNCSHGIPVSSPTAVVRTAFQQETGGYCSKMLHTSDMEMWMRVAVHHSIGVVREPQAYYRWHGQNMSLGYTDGPLNDIREQLEVCRYVFDTWGRNNNLNDKDLMSQLNQRLAREALWLATNAFDAGRFEDSHTCFALAQKCDPIATGPLRSWRLSARRALGVRLTQRIKGLQNRLAGRDLQPQSHSWPVWASGGQFGWWPADGGAVQ